MWIHKHTLNITASTASETAFYSTILSGRVYGIRFINESLSTARTITLGRESSGDPIFKSAWPSSDVNRFPRIPIHGSTGNVLKSTDFLTQFPLCRERIKCTVDACSSEGSRSASLVAYICGG